MDGGVFNSTATGDKPAKYGIGTTKFVFFAGLFIGSMMV
jgi:hypothetical protein